MSAEPILRGRFFAEPAVRLFNNLYLSVVQLSPATVEAYVNELVAYRPTYIEAYPTAARLIAEWILRQPSLPSFPGLKAVFLSSETVSEKDRQRIGQAFGSPAYNKYGNSEQATIIGQCEHGTHHEFEEYAFTEYLPVDEGQAPAGTAEIVSTTFVNRATPLIRYRTGDLAVLSSGSCACGRGLRTVQAVLGREQDYLLTARGEQLTAALIGSHIDAFDRVARFQYYQEEPGFAVIRVVPLEPLTDDQARDIIAQATRRSGGRIEFSLEVVHELELTERGKGRLIVRMCDDAACLDRSRSPGMSNPGFGRNALYSGISSARGRGGSVRDRPHHGARSRRRRLRGDRDRGRVHRLPRPFSTWASDRGPCATSRCSCPRDRARRHASACGLVFKWFAGAGIVGAVALLAPRAVDCRQPAQRPTRTGLRDRFRPPSRRPRVRPWDGRVGALVRPGGVLAIRPGGPAGCDAGLCWAPSAPPCWCRLATESCRWSGSASRRAPRRALCGAR